MKPLDFASWFDDEAARFAVLSTFEFDPSHFESRLLCSSALNQARRILVFVDAHQFQKSLVEKRPARWINQRYLVLPIQRKRGVFHSKLGLLLGEKHARVFCGSNNLTQPGSAHNLELLNSIFVTIEDRESLAYAPLVKNALSFFKTCAKFGEGHTSAIAEKWLDEAVAECGWLPGQVPGQTTDVEFVHSLNGSLWTWFERQIGQAKPSKVEIISPFYDSDLRLIERLRSAWPQCQIEITAQQKTSFLPAQLLKGFGRTIRLFDLTGAGTRRLHAKLVAVTVNGRTVCLAGSANFTAAAFDGLNVETCFGWEAKSNPIKNLFNGDLQRIPIRPEEFEAGEELPPEDELKASPPLRINSAVLDTAGTISVSFSISPNVTVRNLSIALQNVGEQRPAVCPQLKLCAAGSATAELQPQYVSSFTAAVACHLIANSGADEVLSPISWLIQEHRLTYEPSGQRGNGGREEEIRETGHGLVEQLDEIGTSEGQLQVIQYLNNLSIRFDENALGSRSGRRFTARHHDPHRPDTLPDWVSQLSNQRSDIEAAVYEFADRHEQKVLQRHARRGNINGLANFLDVLVAVAKLLFMFYRRGILNRHHVVFRITRYIEVFTDGVEGNSGGGSGYIAGMQEALSGNANLLRKTFDEHNVVGHLQALLLIAQTVRCDTKDSASNRPCKCLRMKAEKLREFMDACHLKQPTATQIRNALGAYEMLTEDELRAWLEEAAAW